MPGYSLLSDYISQTRTLLHDPSAQDYTDAQLTPIINNARMRVAQDLRCVRQFITGLNTITQQETYPLTGFVGGIKVLTGGVNYTNPTFTLTGGGGSGAAASALLLNGAVSIVNMTSWGGGYTSTPTLTVTDPTGTGATFQVIAGLNIHDILTMTALWSQPISALALTFSWLPFGAFQAFCRAYRSTFANPGAYTIHYGTTSPTMQTSDARVFFMYPIPNQPYPLEMDVSVLPNNLLLATDVDYQVVPPWNDAVQYFAAHLGYLGLQQYQQASALKGLYDGRVTTLPATGFVRRVHSFYRSYRALVGRI